MTRSTPAVVASLPVESIQEFGATTSRTSSRRNVFAFEEVTYPTVSRAPEPVAVPQPVVAQSEEPKPPKVVMPVEESFPYRYIGRFGPDANPIAVFVANGEVVNARAGEAIAGGYRLRSIGIESVDVATSTGLVKRVNLER